VTEPSGVIKGSSKMAMRTNLTRAELIRQRREKVRRPGKMQNARRTVRKSPVDQPPMLVRGALFGSQVKARQKTKRRFDVALDGLGAEMSLPALPQIALGWRFVSMFLAALFALIAYQLWNNPLFQVNDFRISGLVRLTKQDINAAINLIGKPVVTIDPEEIEARLKMVYPQLSSVEVDVQIPADIRINALERQPVLTWQLSDTVWWVDAQGFAFPATTDTGPAVLVSSADLPEITEGGQETSLSEGRLRRISPDLVNVILRMSDAAPEGVPLVFDNQKGFGWQDPRGWTVYFGKDTSDIDMKLRVYKVLWKRLKKAGIQPTMISVEHVHAPYFRVER
jgi:hypothetical protein